MPQCVTILPAGSNVGTSGPNAAVLSVPMLGIDSSCASGLQILTAEEIQANKTQLTVDKSSDSTVRSDLFDLFYAFIVVLIAVWGVKRLLDLFSGEGDK